jgi:hypothetical protein
MPYSTVVAGQGTTGVQATRVVVGRARALPNVQCARFSCPLIFVYDDVELPGSNVTEAVRPGASCA